MKKLYFVALLLATSLFLSLSPQRPKLKVFNPTPHVRTQYILYGHHDPANVVMKLPRSYINVAKVTVPSNHDGEANIAPEGNEPFDLGAAFKDISKKGWRLSLNINNEVKIFEAPLLLVDHSRVKIYIGRMRYSNAVVELITYVFHQANYIKYELTIYCENKTQFRTNINAKLAVVGQEKYITNIIRHGYPDKLLDNQPMIDGQGRRFMGVLFFHNEKLLKDEVEKETLLAEYEYPLYGVARWAWWGPWKEKFELPAGYSNRIHADKARTNYYPALNHFGWLNNKRPADTGFQQDFAPFSHLDTVLSYSAKNMYADQLIVNQEACRPTHFFEENLALVSQRNHPKFVVWDERYHYHKVVSEDQLGRTYDTEFNENDWHGADFQHNSATFLAEDFLLNGMMGSLIELRHKTEKLIAGLTLPSAYPRWSTNNPLIGREGRTYLSIVYVWLCTGDKRLVSHVAQHIRELLEPEWVGKTAIGPIKPTRVLDDPRTGIPGPAWIIWEDAIFVMGSDALREVMRESQIYDVEQILKNIIWQVGKSVVTYGFHPETGRIGIAMRWDSGLPINDYNNKDLFTGSEGTAYGVWALPCLNIMKRLAIENLDEVLVALTNKRIDGTYKIWSYDEILNDVGMNGYLGSKGVY